MNDWSDIERELHAQGMTMLAGIDEVGRGPLAGPVVAACVIMPLTPIIEGVKDSKKCTPKTRERLFERIEASALAIGVGCVDQDVIDRINILQATRYAMHLAARQCARQQFPEHIMIDAVRGVQLPAPYTSIIAGDTICYSIAAASIVAKVIRDRMMVDWDAKYPGYGFAKHKGYGTSAHYAALDLLGSCPLHRRSFLRKWEASR